MAAASALGRVPSKARVEALVDGIFAVAMTLLVLDIKLPEGVRLDSNAQLLEHFSSLTQAFLVYVLSFVVLAMFWAAHNNQFHLLQRLDRPLLWTNFAFLLLTTMVPFTTDLVSSHGNLSLAATLYAANLLLLGAALWLHLRCMRAQPGLAGPELTPAVARAIQRRIGLFCGVAVVAMAVAQLVPAWGTRTFLVMLLLHFLPSHEPGGGEAAG
jgi:uncharacterized membrane protein